MAFLNPAGAGPPSDRLILSGAAVLTPQGVLPQGSVVLNQGQIEQVLPHTPAARLFQQENLSLVTLPENTLLAPGLIDLQLNGALGIDWAKASIATTQTLLSQLPQYGITSVLATLISAPLMDMVAQANTLEEALRVLMDKTHLSRLLGLHLEGPFLNPAKAGIHPASAMPTPQSCPAQELALLLSPSVKLMTLAPEQPGALALLKTLKAQNIKALAGHTLANQKQLEAAQNEGLLGVTHLFNAMAGFSHRQPGTALHILNSATLKATFIADGHHIHPDVIRLAYQLKGPDSLILVSDAMVLAGLEESSTAQFGNQSITSEQGRAVNAQGTLAGSVQLLPKMIENLVNWDICTLSEAITLASTQPAKLLGLENQVGQLITGAHADLTLWDQQTNQLLATWVGGHLLWCAPAMVSILSPTQTSAATV